MNRFTPFLSTTAALIFLTTREKDYMTSAKHLYPEYQNKLEFLTRIVATCAIFTKENKPPCWDENGNLRHTAKKKPRQK